jgi:hypothetical protein
VAADLHQSWSCCIPLYGAMVGLVGCGGVWEGEGGVMWEMADMIC